MGKSLCPDVSRMIVMAIAASLMLIFPSFIWGQIAVILLAGIFGAWYFSPKQAVAHEPLPIQIGHSVGIFWISLFFALLLIFPALVEWCPNQALAMISAFYRAGSLVFGGGHVVLPLLQAEVVPTGWVNNETFLAGYGATQAMPGPLFAFAALMGVNASVVGILLSALYDPVWTSAIHGPIDFALGLIALLALTYWKLSPWLVVLAGGVVCGILPTFF